MPEISFRTCSPEDAAVAVPLIFNSGPAAFRYVFSENSQDQVLEFLHSTFVKQGSEFGFQQHTALLVDGQLAAVGGIRTSKQNVGFLLNALKAIISFYPIWQVIKVIFRGLQIEQLIQPPAKERVILYDISVSEQFQGQGLGQKLIAHLLQQAKSQGYNIAALDVAESNPRAKSLYSRLGFKVLTTRQSKLKGKYSEVPNHTYMELTL